MSRLANRLARRIKKEFDIEVTPKIYRTRSGRHQKAAGAWSWWMIQKNNPYHVGSSFPASEVAKAKFLSGYYPGWGREMEINIEVQEPRPKTIRFSLSKGR